ncbi:MAG TPA: hypothetical protein VNC16_06300 [Solirubrobacterales bacterium]|nr:hypothetical protein [Solirubrobacterales bacterium]
MILVSDQRLTDVKTGRPVTDRANKAVADLRSPQAAFAYTGIAEVAGKPTDEWIMETMAEGDNREDSLVRLRDVGTREFASVPLNRAIKRLAIIGCGWGVMKSGPGELEPYVALVSNFAGRRSWLPKAEDSFELRWFYPHRDRHGIFRGGPPVGAWTAGQVFSRSRSERLIRQITRGLARTPSVAVSARIVAEAVRDFASSNTSVGKGLVVISVPRPVPGQEGGISSPTPPVAPRGLADHFKAWSSMSGEMSFLYLPPDLSAPPASYGPMVIDEGMQIKGIEMWVGEEPPWWKN